MSGASCFCFDSNCLTNTIVFGESQSLFITHTRPTMMISGPRKQRTRQHVIADLGVHFLEGFILEEGYTARRLDSDYSYDLVMNTFDANGYAEPGPIYFQVKAS